MSTSAAPGSSSSNSQTISQSNPPPLVAASLQDLVHLVSQTVKPKKVKAPRYAKTQDLAEYLSNFERVIALNGWGDDEAGIELQNALEGDALSHALTVQTTSFTEITKILKERLVLRPEEARVKALQLSGNHEDIDDLANQCRRLIDRGFGPQGLNITTPQLEEEKIRTFLRGLKKKEMAVYVKGQRPQTLPEAVTIAREYKILVKDTNPSKIRSMETEDTLEEILCQFKELKAKFEDIQCFNCGGNHFRRNCPALKKPLN
jgi:hypothetical protein